jgi:transcriptional regulator with XRE-family HTH domain
MSAPPERPPTRDQLIAFGKLLRDKRNAAGLRRVQLARKAKLSDTTIKLLESARHPPSRATLIRLIGVTELKLGWADVPWNRCAEVRG